MDLLRSLVSGPRSRYVTSQFNLDLSYITPRVIAMSFPATDTLEGLYRNRIEDVAAFFRTRHASSALIINLSERPYDGSRFDGAVLDLGFPDHHSPPLEIAWTLCLTIDAWLSASRDHVVAVHCLAGKGRTGVIICCYLLFSGHFFAPESTDTDDFFMLDPPHILTERALSFFARARGDNITYASQQRVVGYFARIIHAALLAENEKLAVNHDDGINDNTSISSNLLLNACDKKAAKEQTRVRRTAARCVRRLRSLPLPPLKRIKIIRICIVSLPLTAGSSSSSSSSSGGSGGGFDVSPPPTLRITAVAHQGQGKRGTPVFYDSSVPESLDAPIRSSRVPHSGVSLTDSKTGAPLFIFYPQTAVAGDIAITLKDVTDGSSTSYIFRVALHTAFFTGTKAPYLRLQKDDVDQGKKQRREYPLSCDFACDIFFEEEEEEEAASVSSTSSSSHKEIVYAEATSLTSKHTREEEESALVDD